MRFVKLSTGFRLLGSKYLGLRSPLALGFAITHRCNFHCSYCRIYEHTENELTTAEVIDLLDQLASAGCIRINFTGGEPLLREDLGAILETAKKFGISHTVSTNGALVRTKLKELKHVDGITVSLDGPKEIQDNLRGSGAFEAATEAVRLAQEHNIPVSIASVISRQNHTSLNWLFDYARNRKVTMHLQFAEPIPLTDNRADAHCLSRKEFEVVIARLLEEKRCNPYLGNSKQALRCLQSGNLPVCAAGRIFFRISADGLLYACWRQTNDQPVDLRKYSLKEALRILPAPDCDGCRISNGLELSLLYKLDPFAIFNRIFRSQF